MFFASDPYLKRDFVGGDPFFGPHPMAYILIAVWLYVSEWIGLSEKPPTVRWTVFGLSLEDWVLLDKGLTSIFR